MPFAPLHFSSGPVVPAFGVQGNMIQMGFSEDGCRLTVQPFFDNVHSDDFGGRAGPPSDSQLLGGVGIIRIEFTKYVKSEMDKLSSYQVGGAAGLFPAIGKFVRQDGLCGILNLTGVNDTYSFAEAYLRENYEINTGTKWRKYIVGWEAWMAKPDYTQIAAAQTRRLFTLTNAS